MSILGKLVKPVHPIHAPWLPSPKTVTLERSSSGKLVNPVQPAHAPAMVPLMPEVSMVGNEVKPLQFLHVPLPAVALPKFPVADEKSSAGNDVRDEQLFHALSKS